MKCSCCGSDAFIRVMIIGKQDDFRCKQCVPSAYSKVEIIGTMNEPTLKDLTWQDMWQRLIDAGWMPHEADAEITRMKQDEEGTP